jgi:hypothetical protein
VTAADDSQNAVLIRTGLPELDPVTFAVDEELVDGDRGMVAWTYTGRPRSGSPFLGVHLTEPFTLRGVTLIRPGAGDGVLLRWYIDWLDALNRAGLNAVVRPVPDGRQPDLADLQQLLP